MIDSDNFNPKNLTVSELNTQFKQPFAKITLDNKFPSFVLEPITLIQYGIPRIDDFAVKSDEYRRFILIPLDPNQPACMKLRSILEKADEYFGSEEFKKKLFGNKYDNYKYIPCIKERQHHVYYNPTGTRLDYCHVKFMNSKEGIQILLTNNGKKIIIKTVTELTKYIKFFTTARFKIRINKIWAGTSKLMGMSKLLYGVGLLMEKISLGNEPEPDSNVNLEPIYHLSLVKSKYDDLKENKFEIEI